MQKVTVIIPSHNVEKFIIKCLESVKNQTFTDYEVLIIDDSFLDETRAIVKEYIKSDARFKIIELDNERKYTLAAARNIGINKAIGEYIVFIDSDDYIEADLIEKAYNFSNDNDTDMCLFNFKQVDIDGSFIAQSNICKNNNCILYTKENFIENFVKYWLGVVSVHYSWNKIFKTSTIKNNNIRYMEELYTSEDMMFNYEVLKCTQKVGYINDVLYNYVRHKNSLTLNNENTEVIISDYCSIYNRIVEMFSEYQFNNIDKINPILFIKLMSQATFHLKTKTNNNYELIEKRFDEYFKDSKLLSTFTSDQLEVSIDFYNNITNAKMYSKEDYIQFFDTIVERNGAIINRQKNL